ncbi:2-(3-amino-3-carboxypropyl)histidine synthase subunit 2 [Porphyridium purpureum]|uniref:2-(3-amino-3-carboxypropyl)histidine synthase subunit 2 n=1 Tax=Porphyridium purpureum TaxID=35688 RepID=A0A5J4Z4A6_PORPP|nr:2-(3-amino-3-carboxypropyl)histidine synthase subunit 2 [Porphyridium purpureum]|eukprot:POR8884..scf295_1
MTCKGRATSFRWLNDMNGMEPPERANRDDATLFHSQGSQCGASCCAWVNEWAGSATQVATRVLENRARRGDELGAPDCRDADECCEHGDLVTWLDALLADGEQSDGSNECQRKDETGETLEQERERVWAVLEAEYELISCVSQIWRAGYHTVALQIPDSDLSHAPFLYAALLALHGDLQSWIAAKKCAQASAESGSENPCAGQASADLHAEATGSEGGVEAADRMTPFRVFVLADTSYGECCVDQVAASHLQADALIHYGRTCLSRVQALDVRYVLPKYIHPSFPRADETRLSDLSLRASLAMDRELVSRMGHRICSTCRDLGDQEGDHELVVFLELPLVRLLPALRSELSGELHLRGEDMQSRFIACATPSQDSPKHIGAQPSTVHVSFAAPSQVISEFVRCEKRQDEREKARRDEYDSGAGPYRVCVKAGAVILWIGIDAESVALRNLVFRYSDHTIELCFPVIGTSLGALSSSAETQQGEEHTAYLSRVRRALKRRKYVLSKAVSAERIGILAGTLAVHHAQDVIELCKRCIVSSGRRAYVLLVGKPNVAKLANFPELDAFVLIACPESSLLDHDAEYLQPVITPFELDAVLGAPDDLVLKLANYTLDLEHVLRNASTSVEISAPAVDAEEDDEGAQQQQLAARASTTLSVVGGSSAAEYLNRKSWKGVAFTEPELVPTKAVQGRSGIAMDYHETS